MFAITAYKKRTTDYQGSLFETDGTTGIALAATDVVRFKAGRGNAAAPDFDLASGTVEALGSTVTIDSIVSPAQYTVRLAESDVDTLTPGTYDCEISVADDSETAPANALLHVERGVLHIIDMLGGDVGL